MKKLSIKGSVGAAQARQLVVLAGGENILLAAEEKDLGAVWLGVYPLEDRVE